MFIPSTRHFWRHREHLALNTSCQRMWRWSSRPAAPPSGQGPLSAVPTPAAGSPWSSPCIQSHSAHQGKGLDHLLRNNKYFFLPFWIPWSSGTLTNRSHITFPCLKHFVLMLTKKPGTRSLTVARRRSPSSSSLQGVDEVSLHCTMCTLFSIFFRATEQAQTYLI